MRFYKSLFFLFMLNNINSNNYAYANSNTINKYKFINYSKGAAFSSIFLYCVYVKLKLINSALEHTKTIEFKERTDPKWSELASLIPGISSLVYVEYKCIKNIFKHFNNVGQN